MPPRGQRKRVLEQVPELEATPSGPEPQSSMLLVQPTFECDSVGIPALSPPLRRLRTPDCMSSPVSHLRNLTRDMQEEARRLHAAQYL